MSQVPSYIWRCLSPPQRVFSHPNFCQVRCPSLCCWARHHCCLGSAPNHWIKSRQPPAPFSLSSAHIFETNWEERPVGWLVGSNCVLKCCLDSSEAPAAHVILGNVVLTLQAALQGVM